MENLWGDLYKCQRLIQQSNAGDMQSYISIEPQRIENAIKDVQSRWEYSYVPANIYKNCAFSSMLFSQFATCKSTIYGVILPQQARLQQYIVGGVVMSTAVRWLRLTLL